MEVENEGGEMDVEEEEEQSVLLCGLCVEKKKATAAGFELARAEPNRFRVCLLNHSDKLSW